MIHGWLLSDQCDNLYWVCRKNTIDRNQHSFSKLFGLWNKFEKFSQQAVKVWQIKVFDPALGLKFAFGGHFCFLGGVVFKLQGWVVNFARQQGVDPLGPPPCSRMLNTLCLLELFIFLLWRVGESGSRVGESRWRVGESPESPRSKTCTVNHLFLSQKWTFSGTP